MELADDMNKGRNFSTRNYVPWTLRNELNRNGKRQRLPVTRCIDIAILLAQGLEILHDAGFTHRDVRPSNIIFVSGIPKLADIDLLAGHDASLPSYIPREYAAPEGGHSKRADLYSLGKTLYEMCTGQDVNSFPILSRDIGHWTDHSLFLKLNKVVGKACAFHLHRRYRSAKDLIQDLKDLKP
jgi:serine/threonine protein kinase